MDVAVAPVVHDEWSSDLLHEDDRDQQQKAVSYFSLSNYSAVTITSSACSAITWQPGGPLILIHWSLELG